MKKEFEKWMQSQDRRHKDSKTVSQYVKALDRISEHYFRQANKRVNLYNIDLNNKTVILLFNELVKAYDKGGDYEDIGENGIDENGIEGNGHGAFRAAIKAYARFLEYKLKQGSNPNGIIDVFFASEDINFTDESVKKIMITQIEELFPGYKIFRKQNQGKGLLVLENENKKELLIIELKSDVADYNVLASIINYSGILSKEFPNKNIKGIIIAGKADESLVNACSSPIIDIGVMKYQMKLKLDKIV
jgi:hypothetical protein